MHFVGRLATYKYYNMDQVAAQALTTFKKIVGTQPRPLTAARGRNGRRPIPQPVDFEREGEYIANR